MKGVKRTMKQNDLVKIRIYRGKPIKKGKNNIPTYYTKMNLVKKGEEEKGKQLCNVTVKFTSDVDVKSIKGYGRISLFVKNVGFPNKYEITEDENGNKKYPVVWVRGFETYEPIERDVENPFVTDEPETIETEIENEETEETDEQ